MPIPQVLTGQIKDLGGGFKVKRLLPAAVRQAVGPFLFMDHFGPVTVEPGAANDVRPHPHVGLATVTYLLEGALMHRDSLGFVQRIEPGALNWMTAGRGIVHSERCPDDMRETRHVNHGIQLWAALPKEHEACAPGFVHTAAQDIPQTQLGAVTVRVLLGHAFGCVSTVKTFTTTVYLDIQLPAGCSLSLPALAPELAVYSLDHALQLDGEVVAGHTLAVLPTNCGCEITADQATRLVVIGGEPLDGPRFMWWNFVSSRKETIAMAAQDWSGHVFGYVVDETEMAPLPDRRGKPERRHPPRPAERRTKLPKGKPPPSEK
ncbi:MAG: pirin family protein [Betaproteobacteria bacterium]|nr:pirin family protein [Betaproteobacteria bacterium]